MADAQRDAVILLSGLHREDIGESVDLAAARFATSLENEAKSVAAAFLLEEGGEEDYGNEPNRHKTRRVTISRKDPGGTPTKVFDLYGLDYRKTLVGDLPQKRPVLHLLSTFAILASYAPRLLFSIRRRSKRSSEKWQVRLGWLAYFVLFAYFLIILGAALGTFASTVRGEGSPAEATTQDQSGQATGETGNLVDTVTQQLSTHFAPATQVMQIIVVWMTAIGLFSKVDLKAWIEKTGLGITAASQYLGFDWRRRTLEDQFAALLNHIGEKNDVQYRRVHIVGYSFGSIVALDALFPYDQPPKVLGLIHTLVTVGCPFDFVRTYWPTYFEGRKQLEAVPKRWINIYAPADVLGSDFMDQPEGSWSRRKSGSEPQPKPSGIRLHDKTLIHPDKSERYGKKTTLDQYSAMEKLSFVGFTVHTQYWEGASAGCYRNIARELFKDDAVLA